MTTTNEPTPDPSPGRQPEHAALMQLWDAAVIAALPAAVAAMPTASHEDVALRVHKIATQLLDHRSLIEGAVSNHLAKRRRAEISIVGATESEATS